MWLIVEQMSEEECQQMCDGHDGRSTFLAKMEELATLAKDYWLFEGLDGVIVRLCNEEDSQEEGSENDESEEEPEDESANGLKIANEAE